MKRLCGKARFSYHKKNQKKMFVPLHFFQAREGRVFKIQENLCGVLRQIARRLRRSNKRRYANIRRRSEAKHCSSLCSQSEGGEYCGGQARAKNPTKICPRALAIFATCSWPSLCEQSELQCWSRNRRLCSAQISAARELPTTFNISILNTSTYNAKSRKRCLALRLLAL